MTAKKLSICIATFKRGSFLGETLETIAGQLTAEVELVVLDGASPDNTQELMERYQGQFPQIRYIRESINSGVDQDYDKAVSYATGEYCWLMTDDDLLRPGAVSRVLAELKDQRNLVIVNAEVRNADFSQVLAMRQLNISTDRIYREGDSEMFFSECMTYLSFIGGVVVRRELWMRRDRQAYYGTLFVHVGVIFQEKAIDNVYVIADPLIVIRYGNAMWTSRGFEIWMFKWPQLVWSFKNFSEQAKALVCPQEPYKNVRELVLKRASGAYGLPEYRQFLAGRVFGLAKISALGVACTPGWLVNTVSSLYCLAFNRRALSGIYDFSRSTSSTVISRWVARIMKV